MSDLPKIIILCGGRGVRIRQLDNTVPKPLIPLGDKSILELSLEHYYRLGFRDFIFCIGYKGDLIREKFTNWRDDIDVAFIDSGENASMLKRISDTRDLVDEDSIVVYGDTINKVDLNELISTHKNHGRLLTMVISEIMIPFGLIERERDRVTKFIEKPNFEYYIGTLAINQKAFDYMTEEMIAQPDSWGLLTLFQDLIKLKEVSTYSFKGLQITFNTPIEHTTAQQQLSHYYTYIDREER